MATEHSGGIRRFIANKTALASLIYLLLASFIAVFCYSLAPDNTPDSNLQVPQIALQPPCYEVILLKQPLLLNPFNGPHTWGSLNGIPQSFLPVPIASDSIMVSGDSISYIPLGCEKRVCTKFIGFDASKHLLRRTFWLGTDKYGRDLLSRLLVGFRVSMFVGGIAVFISLLLGVLLGGWAGYKGGITEHVILLVANTFWSIPTILLIFAIVLALGRDERILFLAVGLTLWVDIARVVRGQVLAIKQLQYIDVAQTLGFSSIKIFCNHILPNLMGPLMVLAAGNFATAILLESGLSYLGFGVQPPTPSWGSMLHENYGYVISGKPYLVLGPACAIALSVLAFNLLGNGLRDAMDVRTP